MSNIFLRLFQLFADGASGDGGASGNGGADAAPATGDDSVDAGRRRLLELGVPEDKLDKNTDYRVKKQPNAKKPQRASSKPTFDELLKDPDYNAAAQRMMQDRVKKSKQAEDNLAKIAPALKKYAEENGLDAENLDYGILARHMNGDYREKALEMGVSEQTAMEMEMREQAAKQNAALERFGQLSQEAQAFQNVVPGFNLDAELATNERFHKLTSAEVGLSVEDAYMLTHKDEYFKALMGTASRRSTEMVSNAIASGTYRPAEGGASAQAPTQYVRRSFADMTPAEQDDFIARVKSGERISPYD